MTITNLQARSTKSRAITIIAGLAVGVTVLAGCSGGSGTNSTGSPGANTSVGSASPGAPVLPVASNPIVNTSTVKALTIDSVLVENNLDASGKATADHLEIALTNSGTADLSNFEVYYTFTDPKTSVTESYYAKLPDSFTIAAGAQRVAHFDNTGAADHFAVNEFSLYYSDTNALDVSVEISAVDAATQTATITKDAGGPETAD